MDESEKITLKIIVLFLPEWISCQKEKHKELEGYELYKQIILDAFGYDLDRMAMEQERALDVSAIKRKIEILRLKDELIKEEKRRKGKHK